MQAAGENGGGANMAFMGMGMNAAGNVMGGMQQANAGNSYQPNFGGGMNQNQGYDNQGQNQNQGYDNQGQNQNQGYDNQGQNQSQGEQVKQQEEDPTEKLIKMKKLLDAGVISQEEFDKMKRELLGL